MESYSLVSGISFFATAIDHGLGGIASANRNVQAALRRMALEHDLPLNIYTLHEPHRRDENGAAFEGKRVPMLQRIIGALLRPELVVFDHVHLARPLAAFRYLPKLLQARTVIFAHGSESWRRVDQSSKLAFRTADLVLTNSYYTLEKMQSTFEGFTGQACPLGLPPQFKITSEPPQRPSYRPSLVAADGTNRMLGSRVMLLVSRLDAREREKGHRELIRVMPSVVARIPDAQLVFVGDGSDLVELRRIAAVSAVSQNIFFAGRVDESMLETLYQTAFAFVMPSRQEGFGLVYLEAMNFALPCIACKGDGGATVVVDGVTGYLIQQPIVDDELIEMITILLENPDHARVLGMAGWKRLQSDFSPGAYQMRLLESLTRITHE